MLMLKLCLFLKLCERSEIIILDSSSFASSICCCRTSSTCRLLKALIAIAAKGSSESYHSPGMFEHFTVKMALVKQLDLAFSNGLFSDMGTTTKTFMCIRSGCLPWLVSRIWLALEKKKKNKKLQRFHESIWKHVSMFCFHYCCLA